MCVCERERGARDLAESLGEIFPSRGGHAVVTRWSRGGHAGRGARNLGKSLGVAAESEEEERLHAQDRSPR